MQVVRSTKDLNPSLHLEFWIPNTSVADPYHFDTDPDPGCEKFVTDPDPG